MSKLFLLSERQMVRISPHFPRSHGKPRVDDRRVISGIIYVIRNGLQWKDAPKEYGPHKTLYNRFVRWSRSGVFERIFAGLAGEGPRPERIMINSTHLKAIGRPPAYGKKGPFALHWAHQGRVEFQAPRRVRRAGQAAYYAADRGPNERPYRCSAAA